MPPTKLFVRFPALNVQAMNMGARLWTAGNKTETKRLSRKKRRTMAKTKCSHCKQMKTSTRSLSNGEKICPECEEDIWNSSISTNSNQVSENACNRQIMTRSSTAATSANSDRTSQCSETKPKCYLAVMLDKITEMGGKIGTVLYLRDIVEESVHSMSAKYEEQKKKIKGLQNENESM